MTRYRVEVRVLPRPGILDPQGRAVSDALHALGFEAVDDVHVGRHITVLVRAESAAAAHARVREMCTRLLANPVTEDFHIADAAEA